MGVASFKVKLKKGDTVRVLVGRDKGKTGKISAIHPRQGSVMIDGINLVVKHHKPTRTEPQGGVRKEPRPLNISKVGLVHPSKKNATSRIGIAKSKSGKKIRTYRQAGNKEIK